MQTQQKQVAPVEKIMLDKRQNGWAAVSIGGCGIVAQALVGRHHRKVNESQGIAFAFAHRVVQTLGFSASPDRPSTPQLLVDIADALIDEPELVIVQCTTWQMVSEQVEICSVGANSVLAFEGEAARKVIAPQTVNELLRRQGKAPSWKRGNLITHALGSRNNEKSCCVEEVQRVLIPVSPGSTVAVIEEDFLVDDFLERALPASELSAFIASWNPPWKARRTSVILSF